VTGNRGQGTGNREQGTGEEGKRGRGEEGKRGRGFGQFEFSLLMSVFFRSLTYLKHNKTSR